LLFIMVKITTIIALARMIPNIIFNSRV